MTTELQRKISLDGIKHSSKDNITKMTHNQGSQICKKLPTDTPRTLIRKQEVQHTRQPSPSLRYQLLDDELVPDLAGVLWRVELQIRRIIRMRLVLVLRFAAHVVLEMVRIVVARAVRVLVERLGEDEVAVHRVDRLGPRVRADQVVVRLARDVPVAPEHAHDGSDTTAVSLGASERWRAHIGIGLWLRAGVGTGCRCTCMTAASAGALGCMGASCVGGWGLQQPVEVGSVCTDRQCVGVRCANPAVDLRAGRHSPGAQCPSQDQQHHVASVPAGGIRGMRTQTDGCESCALVELEALEEREVGHVGHRDWYLYLQLTGSKDPCGDRQITVDGTSRLMASCQSQVGGTWIESRCNVDEDEMKASEVSMTSLGYVRLKVGSK
ncbi:hypothetical protein FIBSPDRAFT_897900 [Athelia psychrophila]|uniref:Uncharacterized protein n=1 Tax=Athelia psychrophila TaxID=1759441 RepID=A0A166BLQ8_9AGAM|nr:hypothetical protein FIBSPDRAFT_897900 [Fibularhizoctonia sp. CBS 109695]